MSRVFFLVFVCFCACVSMVFGQDRIPPNCTDMNAVGALAVSVKGKVPGIIAAHTFDCTNRCNMRKCRQHVNEVDHDGGCLNATNVNVKELDLKEFNNLCLIGFFLTVNTTLRLGDGPNCVFLNHSTIQKLEGGPDEDDVFAYNTSITITDLKDGNDVFSLNSSYGLDIDLGKGNDSVFLMDVYVRDVNGSDGDDNFYLWYGYAHSILGGDGDDTAFFRGFRIESTNLGYGRDVLVLKDGTGYLVDDPDEGLIVTEEGETNTDTKMVAIRPSKFFTCQVTGVF